MFDISEVTELEIQTREQEHERGSQLSISLDWRPADRLSLRSWHSRANAHRPLSSNRKRNRQLRLLWVHPPSTISRAGKGKRRGGRTSTSKISRRNSSLFARKSAHSGACFFSPRHSYSQVYHSSTLQKKTDSELFVVDTKGDDKGTTPFLFLTLHLIIRSPLSPKVSSTLLPRLP